MLTNIKWNVIKLQKNTYKITKNDEYIIFKLESDFSKDYEILFNANISNDGIIFLPKPHMTFAVDSPIIGIAIRYENQIFIEQSLVSAVIIETNIEDAKTELEMICV